MHDALRQLEELLRRYGHVYEANQAAIARRTFERDPAAACRMMNSGEWWNDTQSIAAIDLAIDGGFTPEARTDAQTLRNALIEVYSIMTTFGEHNDAGEIIVSQFNKWAESHI